VIRPEGNRQSGYISTLHFLYLLTNVENANANLPLQESRKSCSNTAATLPRSPGVTIQKKSNLYTQNSLREVSLFSNVAELLYRKRWPSGTSTPPRGLDHVQKLQGLEIIPVRNSFRRRFRQNHFWLFWIKIFFKQSKHLQCRICSISPI
jgi:hypothetical protein